MTLKFCFSFTGTPSSDMHEPKDQNADDPSKPFEFP